jgi:hypothetical protein
MDILLALIAVIFLLAFPRVLLTALLLGFFLAVVLAVGAIGLGVYVGMTSGVWDQFWLGLAASATIALSVFVVLGLIGRVEQDRWCAEIEGLRRHQHVLGHTLGYPRRPPRHTE